jgi:hypothetical protein
MEIFQKSLPDYKLEKVKHKIFSIIKIMIISSSSSNSQVKYEN